MTTLRPPATIRPADVGRDFPAILGLYKAHGWTHASDPTRLRIAVESSSLSIVAVDDEGAVIGFARAMSDQAFAVYIADVLVAPDHQRRGVGRALMQAILDHYPPARFHHQVLMAERGAEGFYESLGLTPVGAYGLTAFIRSR
ncbi:MAG: GNAT family N-acetyltransferase [Actinomycetota bacterium]